MSESDDWYQKFRKGIREGSTKCCGVHPVDAGECSEGCCDRWKCPACGKTWLVEVGD